MDPEVYQIVSDVRDELQAGDAITKRVLTRALAQLDTLLIMCSSSQPQVQRGSFQDREPNPLVSPISRSPKEPWYKRWFM